MRLENGKETVIKPLQSTAGDRGYRAEPSSYHSEFMPEDGRLAAAVTATTDRPGRLRVSSTTPFLTAVFMGVRSRILRPTYKIH